jgi:Na+/H+ antiporter NhaD/arsenite permease-like protein
MKFSSDLQNKILNFYYDGFTSMSWWGKKMWIIIIVKLFIMLAILKVFFFPDILQKNFDTDKERSEYVIDQLINQ